MKIARNALLTMLNWSEPTVDVRNAESLLRHPETRADAAVSRQPADEVLFVWKLRQRNLQRKGITAYGLDSLVTNLQGVEGDAPVLGHGYTGPSGVGLFFVGERDGRLLGFVITPICKEQ